MVSLERYCWWQTLFTLFLEVSLSLSSFKKDSHLEQNSTLAATVFQLTEDATPLFTDFCYCCWEAQCPSDFHSLCLTCFLSPPHFWKFLGLSFCPQFSKMSWLCVLVGLLSSVILGQGCPVHLSVMLQMLSTCVVLYGDLQMLETNKHWNVADVTKELLVWFYLILSNLHFNFN